MNYIANNKNYKILTAAGFKHFAGIQELEPKTDDILNLTLSSGRQLKTSWNHKLKLVSGEYAEVNSLIDGSLLSNNIVLDKIEVIKQEPIFDVIGVEDVESYITEGVVSHNCSFLGSIMTLVNPSKLQTLRSIEPLSNQGDLKIYTPEIDSTAEYALIADVSHGKGLDYHAFSVIRIDKQPFTQVAAFRNNLITPIEYAEVIFRTATRFNNAYVLIELNDMGAQVSKVLTNDLEYDYVIHSMSLGRKGQVPCFWMDKADSGVRTTRTTKAIGCSMIKNLIENDIVLLNDKDTIAELTSFVRSDRASDSYCAQAGKHDDTVMPLVLFGWLVNSDFFRNLTNVEIRNQLRSESQDQINAMATPVLAVHVNQPPEAAPPERIDGDRDLWHRVSDNDFLINLSQQDRSMFV